MKEKQTLTREYAPPYRQADRKTKSGILDEYSRSAGYHRKYAGCRRFGSPAKLQALASVYHSLNPLLNYFLPTVKLIDKQRVGSRARSETPFPQSMTNPGAPETVSPLIWGYYF
jgi:hypothetical protein